MPDTTPSTLPFKALWITESLRLREEILGYTDDNHINRLAQLHHGNISKKLSVRAETLARRDGLEDVVVRWLSAGRAALFFIVIAAILTGIGLAITSVSRGEQAVNIFWALLTLLGIHFLTLLFWSIQSLPRSLLHKPQWGILTSLWAWLASLWVRLTAKKDEPNKHLGAALMEVARAQHLLVWGSGVLVHGFWIMVYLSVGITLIILFSVNHYVFLWQSTLLNASDYEMIIHYLSWLPSQLGFPNPTDEIIALSNHHASPIEHIRQTWANWLLGVIFVYGFMIRVLFFLVCVWFLRRRLEQAALPLHLPYYQRLIPLLMPRSQSIGIVDPAPILPIAQNDSHKPLSTSVTPPRIFFDFVLGIELTETPSKEVWSRWGAKWIGCIDTWEDRQVAMDYLMTNVKGHLLVLCDRSRSPDRGAQHFMQELIAWVNQMHVLLVGSTDARNDHSRNWMAVCESLQIPVYDLTINDTFNNDTFNLAPPSNTSSNRHV